MQDPVALRMGQRLAALLAGLGVVYAVGLAALALTASPGTQALSDSAKTVLGIATLLTAQVVLALVVCVHCTIDSTRRTFTHLALLFTTIFTAVVSINRFVQLTVVRHAVERGQTEGLWLFLPYSSKSAMFALEILGWGLFLALALLLLGMAFRSGGAEARLRWTSLAYVALSGIGVVGYALQHRAAFAAGFFAWALVLYIWAALLFTWFRQRQRGMTR